MATQHYKFQNVPKTFTTRAAAIRFLRNSPGYVQRQSAYLQEFWPGLSAELGVGAPKVPPVKLDPRIAAQRLNTQTAGPANPAPASPGELAQIRGNVIANQALQGLGPTIAKSAQAAPSALHSGLAIGRVGNYAPAVLGLPYKVTDVRHPVRAYQAETAKKRQLDQQMKEATLAGDQERLNSLTRQGAQQDMLFANPVKGAARLVVGRLTPQEERVAAQASRSFGKALKADPAKLVQRYQALPETHGGRLIDTDIARELSPHYRRSPNLAPHVHDTASAVAKLAYKAQLARPVDETPLVVIRGGGAGAGKSTVAPLPSGAITYDTTLSNFASAKSKIDAALASGRDVHIQYVYRDPAEAMRGVAQRAAETGRTVPVDEFVRTHAESNKVVRQIGEAYTGDGRVTVSVLNNSLPGAPEVGLSGLPETTYTGVRDALNAHATGAAVPSRNGGAAQGGVSRARAGEFSAGGSEVPAFGAVNHGRAERGGSVGVPGGAAGEAPTAGGVDTRITARVVPRTPEAVDARIAALEAKFQPHIDHVVQGLRQEGVGKGERRSLARGQGNEAFSIGEREARIQAEWKKANALYRAGKGPQPPGSWEELAITKYGAYTNARGEYKGFDAENANRKAYVATEKPPEWYRAEAVARIRTMAAEDVAKGDRRAQAVVRALDELESLQSLRSKNAGAALFPEDVPAGGYGVDLQVERAAPARVAAAPVETAPPEVPLAPPAPPTPPRPPVVAAAEAPPPPPPAGPTKTLNETVQEALKGATEAIAAQNAAYSPERAIRAKGAMKAYYDAGGGSAGRLAARGELKGPLPVVEWNGFKEMTPETVDAMTRQIFEGPHDLQYYDMEHAVAGLERALQGRPMQRHQLLLLERVFPKKTVESLTSTANRDRFARLYEAGLQTWNIPRTVMASFDLSAPFRQGLVAGSRHPVIFAKNFGPMVKAFGSERLHNEIINEIPTRANFERYGKMKLDIGVREEQFPGSYADNVPGIKGSGRAYSAFLIKMRVDVADRMIALAASHGKNIDDPQFLDALGEYLNWTTGRGRIPGKHGEDAAQFLNTFLFSPRLLAARFQALNPNFYIRLYRKDPFVAAQALRAAGQTLAGITAMVYAASNIPGAKVGLNPLSADFGKVRVGDTRVDFAGGFQPLIVLYARLLKKKSVSSSSGQTQDINGGFGTSTRPDLVYRFFQSKMSPTLRLAWDRAAGQTYVGDPVTVKGQLASIAPLNAQGAYDAYKTDGPYAAAASAGLGSVGFGVGSYPDTPAKTSGNWRSGGSSANDWRSGGSSANDWRNP